jgi:hypothetical protein
MLSFSFVARGRGTLLLALLVVARIDYATGQSSVPQTFPGKSAAELMQSYNSGAAGTARGQSLLIGVLNKTLPATDANIKIVRQSLAKASAVEDKVLLIRVLASMYTPRLRSQQNLLIEGDIKKLVNSAERRVAMVAALEYSRLSYPSDRYEVLQRARDANVLDDDGYYGELAHGLRFSSLEEQAQMMSELEGARNQYANDILASTFSNTDSLGQLNQSVQRRLLNLLSSREPGFPLALASFGAVDMARYVTWMDGVATIESALSGKPYAELVLARLSGPQVDPRKILAVFANSEGQRVIRESKDVNQLRKLLARAQAYSYSLPQNVMLSGAAASFAKRMAGIPAPANQ